MTFLTASEVASKFFRENAIWTPEEITLVGTTNTMKVIKTAYFLSARQFAWLYKTAQMEDKPTVQISNSRGRTIISGSFIMNGIEYGFTATTLGNGAAKFELVVTSMHQTMEEKISIYNITLLFMIAADEAKYGE